MGRVFVGPCTYVGLVQKRPTESVCPLEHGHGVPSITQVLRRDQS